MRAKIAARNLRESDGLDDARMQPNHGEAVRIGFMQKKNADGGWANSNNKEFE